MFQCQNFNFGSDFTSNFHWKLKSCTTKIELRLSNWTETSTSKLKKKFFFVLICLLQHWYIYSYNAKPLSTGAQSLSHFHLLILLDVYLLFFTLSARKSTIYSHIHTKTNDWSWISRKMTVRNKVSAIISSLLLKKINKNERINTPYTQNERKKTSRLFLFENPSIDTCVVFLIQHLRRQTLSLPHCCACIICT